MITQPKAAVMTPDAPRAVAAVPAVEVFELRKDFWRRNKDRNRFGRRGRRRVAAIRGVSFSMARGETIAILGQNGSGKSTLVRLLSTLLDAERSDYESRAHDLLVQHLCALKLDLAIEAGLQQENGRVAADVFAKELEAAVPARKDRLLSNILADLDLAGYGSV